VHWPASMQWFDRRPAVLLDGAHNPPGIAALVAAARPLIAGRPIAVVFAAMHDKDVAAMVSLLRSVAPVIVATTSSNPRALPADALASLTGGTAADRPTEALDAARVLAGRTGAVVVCGSLYLLHDLIAEGDL